MILGFSIKVYKLSRIFFLTLNISGLQADIFEQYNIEGVLAAINNFNTSSLHGIAAKLEKVFVNYLDELEDSDWLDSLLTTVENSVSIDPAILSVIQYDNEKKKMQ